MHRFHLVALQVSAVSVLAVALWGCGGGGGGSAPQNNATVAPLASPMSEVQKEIAALPLSQAAPIPRGMNCKGNVVWVNVNTKSYHRQGDPYFGRTKHGEYMCEAAADAAGYHLAGSHHASSNSSSGDNSGSMNGMSNMSNMPGMSNGSTSGSSTHHHHRSSSSNGN
jgi:hypothetical protein